MKDEIKEINLSEMLFNRDERLLDYITNLQQIEQDHQKLNGELREENQRLKETIENLTTMTVCGDRKQIKNTAQYKLEIYKSRNEKATKYIKSHKQRHDIDGSIADLDEFDILASPKTLLNILNGGDKDES